MEYKSDHTGTARDKAMAEFADGGKYAGFKPSKRHAANSGVYVNDKNKEVYVTHYRTGVSHIDEEVSGVKRIISEMIMSHITEGTRGETGLVNPDGSLTNAGYKAMYAWRKAGHRGEHDGIRNEREMFRKKRDVSNV